MHHRLISIVTAFCVIATTSPDCPGKPNVLLITVDDMNFDSVGAFGCRVEGITPHIDRLAEQGMCFDRGFVNVAICHPTRAVWMTGRYPQRNGAMGFDPINADVPSLPEAMKAGGYYIAMLGKESHTVPSRHHAFDTIKEPKLLGMGRDPALYAAEFRTVIASAKAAGKPFLMIANSHDPHRPFAGSDQEKWRPRPTTRRIIRPDEVQVPTFLPDLPQIRREMAEYFTSVHRADEMVGAMLAELERAGLTDETLVMFMSDHGMPLPFAKTNCYEHSTRTPWIVRWPGVVKPGSRDEKHFVSGIDVAPTLLDAAGLAPLPGADGSSIVPLMKGGTTEGRNRVFTMIERLSNQASYPMRAVRDERYLYIWNGWADGTRVFMNESQSGRTMSAMREAAKANPEIAKRVSFFLHRCTEELYDIQNDPDCLNNLIGLEGNPMGPVASAMTKQLWHWMKESNDPQLGIFQKQVELALD
jgi:N-sulfoglucosamine sulfohydrolase